MKVYDFDLMIKQRKNRDLSLSFDIYNVCEHWSIDILSLSKFM